MDNGNARNDAGTSAGGGKGSRVILLLTWAAVALWFVGVAILVLQHLAGGPTYDYWLETTVSAALITPIALLLLARRPDHRLSQLYAGFVIVGALQLVTGVSATALTVSRPAAAAIFAIVHEAAQGSFVTVLLALVLLYPTGDLPSRRWRPVAWALLGGGAVAVLSAMVAPQLSNFAALPNPLGIHGPAVSAVNTAGAVVFAVGAIGAIVGLLVRRHRSRGIERLQLRWFTFTVLSGIALLLGGDQFLPNESVYGSMLWTFVPSAVLASIGVAVFRYRLLEIDRIISRTVAYAVVSALLVALYGVCVFVLTPALAGIGGGSNVAVAAATLIVAAAFGPVRRRVQTVIDRRFNRGRYDAERTVEAFASGLRDKVDIEQLADQLVEVVGGAVAPRRVSLWLSDPQARLAARR